MKKSEMVCATCIKGDQWKNKFWCFNFPSTEEINGDQGSAGAVKGGGVKTEMMVILNCLAGVSGMNDELTTGCRVGVRFLRHCIERQCARPRKVRLHRGSSATLVVKAEFASCTGCIHRLTEEERALLTTKPDRCERSPQLVNSAPKYKDWEVHPQYGWSQTTYKRTHIIKGGMGK